MTAFRVSDGAGHRLDQIYTYSRERWGEPQAEGYIRGLFARFQEIADRRFPWRAVPAEFGIDGYVCRYEQHVIYWRLLDDDAVGVLTVLHARMHQISRFREDFEACVGTRGVP